MSGPPIHLLRRTFLAGLGGALTGLALGSRVGAAGPALPPAVDEAVKAEAAAEGAGLQPNLFVHVTPNGGVVITCARAEMGQGVRSSLPVLIADELGADMRRVEVVQAPGDPAYGDQNTDGSHSVRGFYDALRKLGACARMMLIAAAAERWKVPASTCEAYDHAVHHPASGRSLGFGELAVAASKLPVPKDILLRPQVELMHVGKELPLLDGPDIVSGRAIFGADVRLPGMLTAVIARPPVVGGRATQHDASKALAVPGVRHVVPLPAPQPPFAFQPLGGIAVVADDTWAALRGRARLEVTWAPGANGHYDSQAYREVLLAAVKAPGHVVREVGDVVKALGSASKRVEATYYVPHLAHAAMEPPAAVVRFDGQKCEVWTATQNPQASRKEVARALDIAPDQVTVHVTLLGGAFGRKSKPDYVVEAALLAKATGSPVRVQWTREDDIQHDYYATVSTQRLEAGLDEVGKVVAWQHRTAFPPIGSTFSDTTLSGPGELQQGVLDVPLAIANVRAENCEAKAHTRIGWLRSVANQYHAFAVQSFIAEIAHARGTDPRETLLEIIGPPRLVSVEELGVQSLPNYDQPLAEHPIDTGRHRRVIERVTDLARWTDRKQKNRALGLAVHRSFLTYVASVVSVIRDPEGRLLVDEVWTSLDAGTLVNRERVRSQFEGAVIFALSHALYGEITMKDGATQQSNFRDYRLMRIGEAPRAIHLDIVDNDGPPGGCGEPGVPPVAPALANAIFALTGQRVRELPIARTLKA
ncbi:xanthine dehydrogenase family protein molybdopterin-binding subunit [Nannocystis radixulma]|uniref:Molybdopterin-dependent oxidoreductase n=1 Tax=Nannocystis radixulma TaxID=2995305 RepID=A0ABT5B8L2_9BACT|nr:molybdopterin cofactor-binding domain-containing protein [Nannocystis radixulma]MDC0670437.1 molybdopterin-dependent oxidoreductase [Nannocystis radixulma]